MTVPLSETAWHKSLLASVAGVLSLTLFGCAGLGARPDQVAWRCYWNSQESGVGTTDVGIYSQAKCSFILSFESDDNRPLANIEVYDYHGRDPLGTTDLGGKLYVELTGPWSGRPGIAPPAPSGVCLTPNRHEILESNSAVLSSLRKDRQIAFYEPFTTCVQNGTHPSRTDYFLRRDEDAAFITKGPDRGFVPGHPRLAPYGDASKLIRVSTDSIQVVLTKHIVTEKNIVFDLGGRKVSAARVIALMKTPDYTYLKDHEFQAAELPKLSAFCKSYAAKHGDGQLGDLLATAWEFANFSFDRETYLSDCDTNRPQ